MKLKRVIQALSRTSCAALVEDGDRANAERRWKDAAAAYKAALDRKPTLFPIWVQYGHALKEQGHLREAEQAYRRAIALDAGNSDARLQLGHVLKLQGAFEEALQSYQTGCHLDPSHPDLVRELRDLSALSPAMLNATPVESLTRHRDLLGSIHQNDQGATHSSLESFLREARLSREALDLFDDQYYFYANSDVAEEFSSGDIGRCLLHFIKQGIDRLHTIREDFDFDAAFYRETYLGGFPLSDAAAYRHWLRGGASYGLWPNRKLFVRSVLGPTADDARTLDLAMHASLRGWKHGTWTWNLAFKDFVATGGGVQDQPTPVTEANAATMLLIADHLARCGTDDLALRVYERILDVVPCLPDALHHYGDALLRRECFLAALQSYERLQEIAGPRPWVFLNRASCEQHIGRVDRALQTIEKAVTCFPGDLFLNRRRQELIGLHLTQEWRKAALLAKSGHQRGGQVALAAAHGVIAERLRVASPSKQTAIKSIALVANQHLAQCKFYRVDQKVEQLEHAGFEVQVFDHENEVSTFLENAFRFQAAIFYRVPATVDLMQAIATARGLGIVTFYEIDDLIFDDANYPPPIENYAGLVDEDEYAGLVLGVSLFRTALEHCEHAIVSTPSLAREMLRLWPDKQVYVHRNGIDSRHLIAARSVRRRGSGEQVTIFYGSGTRAHKEDFADLAEYALIEVGRRHGSRIRLVIAGHAPPTDRLVSAGFELVLIEGTASPDQYWSALSAADINLAVLRPTVLTDTKSEIKWLEAAIMGIPSIVSNTATHVEVLESGIDAMICRTREDWILALEGLIKDSSLRKRIGEAARTKAYQEYSLAALSTPLRSFFHSVAPLPAPKPRILIVNVFYPPQAIGGATRVVHDNVTHLHEQDGTRFHIEVACSIEGDEAPFRLRSHAFDGVRVHGISTPNQRDIDRVVFEPGMGDAFCRILDAVKPDIVHFHCIQRLTVAVVHECWKRNLPYVVTVHDGWWISGNQFLVNERTDEVETYDFSDPLRGETVNFETLSGISMKRAVLDGAKHVLAVSRSFAEIYRESGFTNVIAVPNGLPPIRPAARKPSPDGRVRLGFVGGLSRHKGFHLLKYALKSGQFAHLRAILIDHAASPGTHREEIWGTTPVEFRPKVRQSDVPSLYAELDVLLAPSVWPESYGLVTREAMHCGCWVVASDRGAIGEDVVEGKNGFRVDVANPRALEATLGLIDADAARFLRSPVEIPTFRTAKDQAEELAALYTSILGEERPSGLPGRSIAPSGSVSSETERAILHQLQP